MLDIKFIRENSELVKDNIKKKSQNTKLPLVDKLLKKDTLWRKYKQQADNLRSKRNKLSLEINETQKAGKNIAPLIKEVKSLPKKISDLEQKTTTLQKDIQPILLQIPNIIHKSVPIGKSEKDNVVRQTIGTKPKFNFKVKNHAQLGEELKVLDFDSSALTSGNGFYFLKDKLALLNQALINYSREFMVSKGYEYVEPPLMIKKNILTGVYSSEEIEQMSYKIKDEDLHLIATSEHPLIGMFINKTIKEEDLPIKITGYSMCFRKEIGSHGTDEKGLFRTHQFNKQEMIVLCHPDDSYKHYKELLDLSKHLFKNLKLPLRELECCSADLADLKTKSADLEAWSPRQKKYFEITSVTNMESAQARRLNIKFVDKKGNKDFVHTLNNTAIATSRALVAIIENYQTKNGEIKIPSSLQKYCGFKKIEKPK
ncbi:MAG: serine--tRNA ligase [Nanoarchaeota archaeon]|jgi:seryl-tRNA synthetase|nr:serine--tRNA ligase [Nanoarchaeota archaeon]|tara:strand:+ start:5034 stop:6314 length:1281 start_codon:yes stop_codon:yes gene_type:complete